MALKFDTNGLANELLVKLKVQLEYACIAWRTEVLNELKHPFLGVNDRPVVEYELRKRVNTIIAYLEANTYVLADSYGTGSLMLTNNPGYAKYKADSNQGDGQGQWNPARRGNKIKGRPAGTYVDIFGRTHTTSGSMKGKSLEGVTLSTGYTIQPTAPSYAIQMAEKWLYDTYLPKAYKYAIQETNFAKYLIES